MQFGCVFYACCPLMVSKETLKTKCPKVAPQLKKGVWFCWWGLGRMKNWLDLILLSDLLGQRNTVETLNAPNLKGSKCQAITAEAAQWQHKILHWPQFERSMSPPIYSLMKVRGSIWETQYRSSKKATIHLSDNRNTQNALQHGSVC